jgi:hypothetical protein
MIYVVITSYVTYNTYREMQDRFKLRLNLKYLNRFSQLAIL